MPSLDFGFIPDVDVLTEIEAVTDPLCLLCFLNQWMCCFVNSPETYFYTAENCCENSVLVKMFLFDWGLITTYQT